MKKRHEPGTRAREALWRIAAAAIGLLCMQYGARAAESTPVGAIASAAESAVRARIEAGPGDVQVKADSLDPRLRLATCDTPLSAFIANDGALAERTSVGVRCAGPVRWTIYVVVAISSELPVLVARQALVRGAPLQPADFVVEQRVVAGLPNNFVTDPASLVGQKLRRPLAAGTALSFDAMVPQPLVRRGEQVTLMAAGNGIEVRSAGVALADGAESEHVRVRSAATQRIVEGVVRGVALVVVPL